MAEKSWQERYPFLYQTVPPGGFQADEQRREELARALDAGRLRVEEHPDPGRAAINFTTMVTSGAGKNRQEREVTVRVPSGIRFKLHKVMDDAVDVGHVSTAASADHDETTVKVWPEQKDEHEVIAEREKSFVDFVVKRTGHRPDELVQDAMDESHDEEPNPTVVAARVMGPLREAWQRGEDLEEAK